MPLHLGTLRHTKRREPENAEGAVAFWTQEGKPIQTSRETFTTMRLAPLTIASLIVLTVEMLRLLGAPGDAFLNRALQRAASKAESDAFLDPDNTGIEGEMPASITHDAASTAATGDTAADIKALADGFEGDLASAMWLLLPSLAVSFALAGATIGAADIGTGQVGYLAGLPAIVHASVPADALVLIDPAGIAITPRIFVTDASTEASIEVTDDDDDSKTTLMGLWQQKLSSLRLIEYVNWFASPGSVSMLTGIGAAQPVTSKGAKV
jgi:HK97 family phage major capsid protein